MYLFCERYNIKIFLVTGYTRLCTYTVPLVHALRARGLFIVSHPQIPTPKGGRTYHGCFLRSCSLSAQLFLCIYSNKPVRLKLYKFSHIPQCAHNNNYNTYKNKKVIFNPTWFISVAVALVLHAPGQVHHQVTKR